MWCFPEHGCGVLVRLRCMRVRVVPIPSASLPIFYLQTRRSEIFGELTMRTVSHSTILNRFVEWLLQTWYKVSSEGGEYFRCYSEKMHMDSASYRSGIFPKQKLWPPDDLQNKPLSRPLTAKKGYNHVVQTSGYNEGRWEWHRSCLRRFMLLSEILEMFWDRNSCRKGSRFWFRLIFSPLSLDILKSFCTVSNDCRVLRAKMMVKSVAWYSVYKQQDLVW